MAATLALLLAGGVLAPRAVASPLDATRVTLDNGMRVVLAPDSFATTVDASLWFAAGSRLEKPAQAGLSLLSARVAFRAGADDPLASLRARGGAGSLVVTPDYTNFSATVPPAALNEALAFLATRSTAGATSNAALATERAALRSERARPDRTPAARAIARLWAASWPGHPYAQTGALPPATMDALTIADVDAWRRTQLAPGSAVLVIAGAFDADSALAEVRRQFGSRARARAVAPVAVTPRAGQRAQEKFDAPVRFCLVGWRGPGAGDPDAAALEMLGAWLGGSPEARLSRSLVDDWKLAVVAQAGFAAQKDGSLLWTLVVVPPDADSSAVETTLLDAAGSVARTAPQAFDVERTRRQLESGVLFALQASRQRAQALGEAELLSGDAAAAARRIEALRRVTPADLQRVAARVMTEPARAIVWMMPANTGGAR